MAYLGLGPLLVALVLRWIGFREAAQVVMLGTLFVYVIQAVVIVHEKRNQLKAALLSAGVNKMRGKFEATLFSFIVVLACNACLLVWLWLE
jgi:hypothetical protein